MTQIPLRAAAGPHCAAHSPRTTWLVTRLSCNYINTLASVLREIRGIGQTTTDCTPVYIDHMTCEEGDARPERLNIVAVLMIVNGCVAFTKWQIGHILAFFTLAHAGGEFAI